MGSDETANHFMISNGASMHAVLPVTMVLTTQLSGWSENVATIASGSPCGKNTKHGRCSCGWTQRCVLGGDRDSTSTTTGYYSRQGNELTNMTKAFSAHKLVL